MSPTEINDPVIIEEKINHACDLNAAVDIREYKGKIAYTYKSRVYEIREENGQRCLAIDVPTHEGHFVSLSDRVDVEVHFKVRAERYVFEARVLGKSGFKLGENMIRVMLVTFPRALESGQRRAYYRVSPSSSETLFVRMVRVDEGEEGPWTYEERLAAIRARILNLGAGGLGVRVSKEQSKGMDGGTRLKLAFRVRPGDEEMRFAGSVRHSRDDPSDRSMRLLGIAFVGVDKSRETIRQIDTLCAYVADVQRQELKASRS